MAEVFRVHDAPVRHGTTLYQAQICGTIRTDEMWEGWVEFVPLDGGAPLRSPRETTQPNRDALAYWASGLSDVYLEGALDRAISAATEVVEIVQEPVPIFDAPAPSKYIAPD